MTWSQTDMLPRRPDYSPLENRILPLGSPFCRGLSQGQHPRAVFGDGYGVVEVGGERAVGGVDRPPVPLADADVVVAERDHGLYGEGHAGKQARSGAGATVVGDLG